MAEPANIVVPDTLQFLLRPEPVKGRECGACTACCTALAVTDLDKPNYMTCKHLCAQGCTIYEQRPHPCRSWSCMWVLGYIEGDERRRPDKLGLMFTSSEGPDGKRMLVAWEIWKNAADTMPGSYVVSRIAAKMPLFIKKHGTAADVLVGPKAVVASMNVATSVVRRGM